MRALLYGATLLAWILVAALVTVASGHFAVTSHKHEASAVIERNPSPVPIEQLATPGATSARSSAGPDVAQSSLSQSLPVTRFRFGFLEFEEEPDAPTE